MRGIVDADFDRIAAAFRLAPNSGEYDFAYAFWSRLKVEESEPESPAASLRQSICAEEALIWRLLTSRALAQLGPAALFEKREKGPATGTSALHPAAEALAKFYERMRCAAHEVAGSANAPDGGRPMGLPERMRPLLEETEVVFDEILGPGGLPGRPPKTGQDRNTDPGIRGDL